MFEGKRETQRNQRANGKVAAIKIKKQTQNIPEKTTSKSSEMWQVTLPNKYHYFNHETLFL